MDELVDGFPKATGGTFLDGEYMCKVCSLSHANNGHKQRHPIHIVDLPSGAVCVSCGAQWIVYPDVRGWTERPVLSMMKEAVDG